MQSSLVKLAEQAARPLAGPSPTAATAVVGRPSPAAPGATDEPVELPPAQGAAEVLRRAMRSAGLSPKELLETPAPSPVPTAAAAPAPAHQSPALRLLQHEREVRGLDTQAALLHHLCNATLPLVRSDLVLVFRRRHRGHNWVCVAHSAVPEVDREAALVRALEKRLRTLHGRGDLDQSAAHVLHGRLKNADDATRLALADCSTPHAYWVPMPDRDGDIGAGVLCLRRQAYSPGETVLLQRLGETYGHAWHALKRRSRLRLPQARALHLSLAALLAVVAIGLVPVQRNVMAPLEVAPRAPVLITAPLNGAVRSILVAPNQAVKTGQPLVQFEDLQARNDAVLAQQRVAVAEARHATLGAQAFTDPNAREELATAYAELKLARLNLRYAEDLLARSVVRSPADGVALYTDRRDWEGRAVQVGEELVQVAQPRDVRYRVEMNVNDVLVLKPGAPVAVYMDNAPLGGHQARVVSVAYTPKQRAGAAESSYTVWAEPTDGHVPRIGGRGSARLYGDEVPLALQLLHRPWAALRQALGY